MRSAVLMHRLRVVAILVLVVLLAAQLTTHHHSLIPEGGSAPSPVCFVCAFGADRFTLDLPLFAAVLVLLGSVVAAADARHAATFRLARSGRAPPSPRL